MEMDYAAAAPRHRPQKRKKTALNKLSNMIPILYQKFRKLSSFLNPVSCQSENVIP